MELAVRRNGAGPRDSELVKRVVAFVERYHTESISLADVAAAAGYSACHLTTAFRRATGMPVTAWIIRRRILTAQRLLSEGGHSVASTCEAAGFSDVCYFTRQFVRHVGLTPARYRDAQRAARLAFVPRAREAAGLEALEAM